MLKKHFLSIFCLLVLGTVQANNVTSFSPLNPIKEEILACNEPAPTDFHVEELGSTSVKLRWTVVAVNAQHRIRTYKSVGNVLVNTVIVTQGQETVTVGGLAPQEAYYSVINAVCENNENSQYEGPTEEYYPITDDLIVSGFTPISSPVVDCTIYSQDDKTQGHENHQCPISGTLSTFRIIDESNSSLFRQFQVSKLNVDHVRVGMDTNNIAPGINFKIKSSGIDPNTSVGDLYQIFTMNNTEIATFKVLISDSEGTLLRRESLQEGYLIQRIISEDKRPAAPTKPRRFQHTTSLTASPNPFSDQLELYLSQTALQPVRVQLNNLAGQTVLDQQFPAGQDQYTLSTEKLNPGFYLLRIEADGEVQTLKVIKSE